MARWQGTRAVTARPIIRYVILCAVPDQTGPHVQVYGALVVMAKAKHIAALIYTEESKPSHSLHSTEETLTRNLSG
jgi:hypothetical protein